LNVVLPSPTPCGAMAIATAEPLAVAFADSVMVLDVTAEMVAPAGMPAPEIGAPTIEVGRAVRSDETAETAALPLVVVPVTEIEMAAKSLGYVARLTAWPFAHR
jgi:hypothetical protein